MGKRRGSIRAALRRSSGAACYDPRLSEMALKPHPPLPGDILADLLPIVREVSSVLDPDALLPAIARQLKRIVDYRILDIFLPGADGLLYPAYVDGYDKHEAWRYKVRPGAGIVGAAARLHRAGRPRDRAGALGLTTSARALARDRRGAHG